MWLYRVGLGPLIGGQVFLLTSVGRRTGRLHTTPVGYGHDPEADVFYLTSGGAVARIGTETCVRIRRRKYVWGAGDSPQPPSSSLEEAALGLAAYMRNNPARRRRWSRWTDRPFDDIPAAMLGVAGHFPMVRLRPVE
ncbi:MAG: hypothetical protein A2Z17_02425 [Gammaproteobacteria bacterium RBG_16_66_13]|nr:MAG: hypothetical protein A2Z17_02425 [Gammaproteobacteria bacterium RBG_16_66_13]